VMIYHDADYAPRYAAYLATRVLTNFLQPIRL
jgi:hypothetical protein